MDIETFRAEVRDWLSKKLPSDWRTKMLGASEEEHVAFQKYWFKELRDAGYVVPHWPKAWGGSELSFREQIVLYEEIARAGAPRLVLYFIALYHAPSTLLEWGTEAQKQKHLPAILSGDEIWCQGFSEPNAGSDLASLKTRARRDGDSYIVSGQKIWSSSAHLARYCLLLARTDPDAKKHNGISYFILDLESEGVERRPIRMITEEAHFNEIFLDDVRIPAENLIGEENEGWRVAMSTLSSERGLTILELAERLKGAFPTLVDLANRAGPDGRRPADDIEVRRQLADLETRLEALRALVNNLLTRAMNDEGAGIEPSIIKIFYSEVLQDFTRLGVELRGEAALLKEPLLMGGGYETGNWMHDYLYSWSWTIAGGTNEIQRNIIAERGLGLPR